MGDERTIPAKKILQIASLNHMNRGAAEGLLPYLQGQSDFDTTQMENAVRALIAILKEAGG